MLTLFRPLSEGTKHSVMGRGCPTARNSRKAEKALTGSVVLTFFLFISMPKAGIIFIQVDFNSYYIWQSEMTNVTIKYRNYKIDSDYQWGASQLAAKARFFFCWKCYPFITWKTKTAFILQQRELWKGSGGCMSTSARRKALSTSKLPSKRNVKHCLSCLSVWSWCICMKAKLSVTAVESRYMMEGSSFQCT